MLELLADHLRQWATHIAFSSVLCNAFISFSPASCQVLELLADHLRQWATHIAFPEAAHLPCVALRGFAKGCAVERFRRSAKQLVDALERNIVYVGGARDSVAFAPQDLAAAGRFMSEDRDKAQVIDGLTCVCRMMMYIIGDSGRCGGC